MLMNVKMSSECSFVTVGVYPRVMLWRQHLLESKLSVVCERVLDRCLAPTTAGGEGCDNMTMILVQLKKPDQSAAVSAAGEKSSSSTQADTELKPVETESSL